MLKFMQSTSPREEVRKSWTTEISWEQPFSYNGAISVLNPVIDIDNHFTEEDIRTALLHVNYAYISELGRYYFIDSIEVIANNLYRYHLSVDVLMTYADIIYNQVGVIARQQHLYDLYLNDGSLRVENYPMVQTLNFPNERFDSWSYILSLAGGGS